MELPNLPTVNFYENPHKCFNFIHIRELSTPKDLIRFAEPELARGHPQVYELFKKELAQSLGLDASSLDVYDKLRDYPCIGGGYVYIFCEGSKYFEQIGKSQLWIRGQSSNYGEADLGLVKRVIEETKQFNVVGIGFMPNPS